MMKMFVSLGCLCLLTGAKVSALDYRTDTLAVRAILDSNGLASISVDSVSDSAQGRIVKLRLNGKSLHGVPAVIGNLTALDSIDFSHNELTDLPLSITSLNWGPGYFIDVSYNHLCNISDTIRQWLNAHSCFCPDGGYLCWNWVGGQICSSNVILSGQIREAIAPPRFTYRIVGDVLQFSCSSAPSFRMVAKLYTVSGKLFYKASGEGNLSISLSNIPQSVFAIDLIINDTPSFLIISTKR
jgi:hypothetical protein